MIVVVPLGTSNAPSVPVQYRSIELSFVRFHLVTFLFVAVLSSYISNSSIAVGSVSSVAQWMFTLQAPIVLESTCQLPFNNKTFQASPAPALVATNTAVSVKSISISRLSFHPGFMIVFFNPSPAVNLLSNTAVVVSVALTATF